MNRVAKKELKRLNEQLKEKNRNSEIEETEHGFTIKHIMEKAQIMRDKRTIIMIAGGTK